MYVGRQIGRYAVLLIQITHPGFNPAVVHGSIVVTLVFVKYISYILYIKHLRYLLVVVLF